jgi:hypothetical protein
VVYYHYAIWGYLRVTSVVFLQSVIVTQLRLGLVKWESHYYHCRNAANISGGGGKCCGGAEKVVAVAAAMETTVVVNFPFSAPLINVRRMSG